MNLDDFSLQTIAWNFAGIARNLRNLPGIFNYLLVVLLLSSNRQKKAGNPGLLLSAFSGQRGVKFAGNQCMFTATMFQEIS